MLPPESESAETSHDCIDPYRTSNSPAIFRALYAMYGSTLAMHISIHDFCKDMASSLGSGSGKMLSATQWKERGRLCHRFLILHAVTPEPATPFWIRLDRRPLTRNQMGLRLSSSTPNSDSVGKITSTSVL
jgi:hypothetical protein